MSINTIFIYIKGNKGCCGVHIEQELENKRRSVYHDDCYDTIDPQNASEIIAACKGLEIISKDQTLTNCKIFIFTNLELLDKFEANIAVPQKLKTYHNMYLNIINGMPNLNRNEPPSWKWTPKQPDSIIDVLDKKLKQHKNHQSTKKKPT